MDTTYKPCGCGDEIEVRYTWEQGENGDPSTPYFETWEYAVIVDRGECPTCGAVLTDEDCERIEQQLTDDGPAPREQEW